MLLFTVTVSAQEYEEKPQTYESMAVENRLYTQTAEFSLFLGILPLDAFTKGLTVGGAYTHHFNDLFAWEILQGFYSFHADTSLRDDLLVHDLTPTPFEIVDWLLSTNFVLKPIYWKGAWFNDSLIHGEIDLLIGGGYGRFTHSNRVAADLGVAFRFYATEYLSFRLDVRHNVFFNDKIFSDLDLHHELWIGLGTSLSL